MMRAHHQFVVSKQDYRRCDKSWSASS